MTKHVSARSFSGITVVRADLSDPKAALAEINKAFAEFKETNEKNLKERDALNEEKLGKINSSMDSLQAVLDEHAKKLAASQVQGGGAPSAEVAEYNKAFANWFRKGRDEQALGELAVKAALSSDSNPDGGYVVTPEMDTAIDRVLGTVSSMRTLARVVSIGTNEYKKLVNMGGAASGWVGERSPRPATATPELRELKFPVAEIYANPMASQNLLDDANIDIAQWLADEVSTEFAEQEGAAFITGDGNNKPQGILGYDTVANASYAWGKLGFVKTGAAAAFATDDPADALIELYYALKAGYRNGASWLISDAVMGTVRTFKDGQDNYLFQPPTGVDMPGTLMGKPVVTDDNMPALGANNFPVAFGNFQRGYLIVDRVGTRIVRDPYSAKPNVQFYTTKRVGGGVQNFEAIKLLKCAA